MNMIYQYKINDEKGWIELFLELQSDYPLYICDVERLRNILSQFKSIEFTIVAEGNYVDRQYRD